MKLWFLTVVVRPMFGHVRPEDEEIKQVAVKAVNMADAEQQVQVFFRTRSMRSECVGATQMHVDVMLFDGAYREKKTSEH